MLEKITPSLFYDLEKNEARSSVLQQKMQQHVNHVLRIAKVGSWILDVSTDEINWSEEMYRIIGISPSAQPDLDLVWEMIHPNDRDLVQNRLHHAIYSGKPYDFVHRIVRSDGTERMVHERGDLIYDEQDNPAYLMGTMQDISEQMQARQKLEESEQRYKSLFQYNLDATFIVDTQSTIRDANLALEKLLGCSKKDLMGRSFFPFIDEKDRERSLEMYQDVLKGEPQTFQLTILTKQGEQREVIGSAVPIRIHNNIKGVIGSFRDVTDQQIVEKQLEMSQQRLLTLIHSMPDFVNFKDGNGRWILANDYALSLFQLQGIDYQGKTDVDLASYTDFYREALLACVETDEQVWKAGKTIHVEERVPKPDGCTLTFDVLKTPIFNADGSRKGLVVVGRDVTERKKAEELNHYLANHDSLTHLPNRRNFEKKLEQFLVLSKDTQKQLAVLYLDLDRFKYINDTLGHVIGDQLLKRVAERITNGVPDDGFVARMGGDEFTVILPTIGNKDDTIKIAQDILYSVQSPFLIEHFELYITTSIGISVFPHNGVDCLTLMKHADVALYRAKELGKNTIQVYNPQLNRGTYKAFILEKDLYKAIQNEEFELYYQPRVDSYSRNIVSAEALIRWNHPEWGMVPPSEFIPLAEETGLIFKIGEWVKETVCKQLRMWKQEALPQIPISINISSLRFMQKDFLKNVKRILEENQMDGKWLEIEITETSLMENGEVAKTTITQLQEMGINISLDDFGTGYSSISYLRDFKVNCIKIDRSFVKEIGLDSMHRNIVKGIIQLAKSLDISIVAEGVETEEQLLFLQGNHCDQIQGYLFSKPVPAEDFKKLLRKGTLEPNPHGST